MIKIVMVAGASICLGIFFTQTVQAKQATLELSIQKIPCDLEAMEAAADPTIPFVIPAYCDVPPPEEEEGEEPPVIDNPTTPRPDRPLIFSPLSITPPTVSTPIPPISKVPPLAQIGDVPLETHRSSWPSFYLAVGFSLVVIIILMWYLYRQYKK